MAADVIGKEETIAKFKTYKKYPVCAVFEQVKKGRILFYEEDPEDAMRLFIDNVNMIERNKSKGVYEVHFFNEPQKKVTIATEPNGTFTFALLHPGDGWSSVGSAPGPQDSGFLAYLMHEKDKLTDLVEEQQETIEELEAQLEEATKNTTDGPALTGVAGVMDTVGAMGQKYPWMQESIKDLITVGKNFLRVPGSAAHNARHNVGAMGNINSALPAHEQIQQGLQIILAYFVKRTGLQGEAANEQGAIDMAATIVGLANLTTDEDAMELALKKLKAFQ